MEPNWGSVPDWLAGSGAVVALLWARRAALAASKTDERQAQQLQEIADDRRRLQAEKIAAWVGWFDYESDSGVDFGTSLQSTAKLEFLVRNSSELPVYYTVLFIESKAGIFPHITYKVVRATSLMTLSPNLEGRPVRIEGIRPTHSEPEFRVGILFRDAQGRFWLRDGGGLLSELSEKEFVERSGELLSEYGTGSTPEPHP